MFLQHLKNVQEILRAKADAVAEKLRDRLDVRGVDVTTGKPAFHSSSHSTAWPLGACRIGVRADLEFWPHDEGVSAPQVDAQLFQNQHMSPDRPPDPDSVFARRVTPAGCGPQAIFRRTRCPFGLRSAQYPRP